MPLRPATVPYAQASSSEVIFLALLTFSMPGVEPLRVVNNTVDIRSRGNLYSAYPFKVTLPNDDNERLPTVTLEIDNVSGELMKWIRGFQTAPTLLLEIVTNINYDVVERSVGYLRLSQVDYDTMTITGSLEVDNILSWRFPADVYDPVQFPGVFAV
jgi:hypothetical protein